jgi:single-strand DNA-binding protein
LFRENFKKGKEMAELKVYGVGIVRVDLELSYIGPNKTPVCNVNLAFNRSYKKDEDWKQETTYLRAQVFGNRAEKMAELLKKGQPVYVDGYLVQNNWTDKEGNKRTTFVATVREFQLCQKFEKNGNNKQEERVPVNASTGDENADIPF